MDDDDILLHQVGCFDEGQLERPPDLLAEEALCVQLASLVLIMTMTRSSNREASTWVVGDGKGMPCGAPVDAR